jgi:FtsP/CotA-like multicopper oxidase with cupredoxin domain
VILTNLILVAGALASGTTAQDAKPKVEWTAPGSYMGGSFNVHVVLTAPKEGATPPVWLLDGSAFTVNGKPYPHDQEFLLKQGTRYRLTFHNRTDDAHPMHLHRHQLEIAEIYGRATSGVIKDTVVVPTYGRASVDFTADQPGLTLFHCHIQHHMDYGFKALLRYS